MSAFDKLGLAMIPSGYKGEADENNAGGFLGKVYSVLPAQTIGDNLITNGTFDVDASWTKGTGWDITGGKAVCDGTQTNVSNLSSNTGETTLAGGTYEITYTITRTNGTVRVNLGNWGEYRSSDGTYTDTIQDTNGGSRIVIQGNADFVGSIDNVSVKLISDGDFDFSRGSDATRVNSQGYIESVQVLSDELVQNGDFEDVSETEEITNGGFDTGTTGWSAYSDSILSWDSNGYAVVTRTNFWTKIRQTGVYTIGKVYKVVVTAKSNRTDLTLHDGAFSGQSFSEVDTFETFTAYFKATSTNLDFGFAGSAGEIPILTIDNISVKEVGQNWTFYDGWSFEDGKATFNDSSTNRFVQSGLSITSGNVYKINFTISNCPTTAHLTIFDSGGSDLFVPNENYVNGEYARYYTATTNETGISFWGNTAGDTFSIDNISVVEVTDDTDIPRLDYSDGCPTLLLEPQRTNYVPYSEKLDSNSYNGGTYTPNLEISPDGTRNAYGIDQDSAANRVQPSIGAYDGLVTMSMYIKPVATISPRLNIYNIVDQSGYGADFSWDGSDFTIVSYGSGNSGAGYEDVGNGWYRLWIVGTSKSGGTVLAQFRVNTDTDISNRLYVWGLQAERGSYPTSYIPTNGSTVTRLADVCNNAGDSTIFNSEEGVLYAEIAALADDETKRYISISDGSNNNDIRLYFDTGGYISALSKVGGSTQVFIQSNDYTQTDFNKIAFKYKENDFALWINGVEVGTDNLGSVNTTNTLNELAFFGNLLHFYGKCRALHYFPEALTDTELQQLTTI